MISIVCTIIVAFKKCHDDKKGNTLKLCHLESSNLYLSAHVAEYSVKIDDHNKKEIESGEEATLTCHVENANQRRIHSNLLYEWWKELPDGNKEELELENNSQSERTLRLTPFTPHDEGY